MTAAVGQLVCICSTCLLTPDSNLREVTLFGPAERELAETLDAPEVSPQIKYFSILHFLTFFCLNLALWPNPKSVRQ